MHSLGYVQEAATSKGVPELLGENLPRSERPSRHPADPHAIRTCCLQVRKKAEHACLLLEKRSPLLVFIYRGSDA